MRSPERPVLQYFGGKWVIAPWIIEHFPPHDVYVEPFGGGASVLMRKSRSRIEVYNDIDAEIVNLFRVLRDSGADLAALVRMTPFARDEFAQAYERTEEPIERARRTLVRSIMGFGSNGHNITHKTGFRAASSSSGSHPSADWERQPDMIRAAVDRFRGIVIENKDAKSVMVQQDSERTLHFVDPPYVIGSRPQTAGAYTHEMTDGQHEELCYFLKTLKGMVVLCGYENEIYKRLGWETDKRETYADGARERTEVLWLNPACVKAQAQQSLFGPILNRSERA